MLFLNLIIIPTFENFVCMFKFNLLPLATQRKKDFPQIASVFSLWGKIYNDSKLQKGLLK